MTSEQAWLTVLTAVLVLAIVSGMITIASLRADLDLLDRQVAAVAFSSPTQEGAGPSRPPAAGGWGTTTKGTRDSSGRIEGMSILSDTFRITLTVRFAGPADLLYEPPVLRGEQAAFHPAPHSLERARYDFLDLATGGEATTTLVFRPTPSKDDKLTLVFNPNHLPTDAVAPRWEMFIGGAGMGN